MSEFHLELSGKYKSTKKGNVDWYYGGGNSYWNSVVDATANIPQVMRGGKVIGVLDNGTIYEYFWDDSDVSDDGLILKNASSGVIEITSNATLTTMYTNTLLYVSDGVEITIPSNLKGSYKFRCENTLGTESFTLKFNTTVIGEDGNDSMVDIILNASETKNIHFLKNGKCIID